MFPCAIDFLISFPQLCFKKGFAMHNSLSVLIGVSWFWQIFFRSHSWSILPAGIACRLFYSFDTVSEKHHKIKKINWKLRYLIGNYSNFLVATIHSTLNDFELAEKRTGVHETPSHACFKDFVETLTYIFYITKT